jgi:hypothetical protein
MRVVSDRSPRRFRPALERQFLQRFCSEDLLEPAAAAIKKKLGSYTWCDSDNRIVFEAVCRLGSLTPLTASQLRQQLPAQATRMGFPDVNWENYLGHDSPDRKDIRDLLEELLAAK